jgi:hypothetical protein
MLHFGRRYSQILHTSVYHQESDGILRHYSCSSAEFLNIKQPLHDSRIVQDIRPDV